MCVLYDTDTRLNKQYMDAGERGNTCQPVGSGAVVLWVLLTCVPARRVVGLGWLCAHWAQTYVCADLVAMARTGLVDGDVWRGVHFDTCTHTSSCGTHGVGVR